MDFFVMIFCRLTCSENFRFVDTAFGVPIVLVFKIAILDSICYIINGTGFSVKKQIICPLKEI